MTDNGVSALVIALVSLITALAGYIRNRATNKKVDDNLEQCKKDLAETQKDRDTLRIKISALETESIVVMNLLPGGKWYSLIDSQEIRTELDKLRAKRTAAKDDTST